MPNYRWRNNCNHNVTLEFIPVDANGNEGRATPHVVSANSIWPPDQGGVTMNNGATRIRVVFGKPTWNANDDFFGPGFLPSDTNGKYAVNP
jgi:hypothetical protein